MSAPAVVAMNVEILNELEPVHTGAGRACSPRLTCSALRPNFAARGSSIRLGESDPLASSGEGLDDVWLPQPFLEVSDGELDGFGERVAVFVSHLFDSNSPIFQVAQKACRSLNGGKRK